MHHGIRGQRWGVRRYQNADGSLTSAGKKKYLTEENFNKVQKAKTDAKYAKAKAKADARTQAQIDKINAKAEKAASKGKDPNKVKEKSFKNMSNEELQNVTYRMNLENNYLNAKRNLANATPKETNKVSDFIKGWKKLFRKNIKRSIRIKFIRSKRSSKKKSRGKTS